MIEMFHNIIEKVSDKLLLRSRESNTNRQSSTKFFMSEECLPGIEFFQLVERIGSVQNHRISISDIRFIIKRADEKTRFNQFHACDC